MQGSTNKIQKLNALILIGGKSKRMGSNKSVLEYYAKPQWEYLVEILRKHVDKVYISVRPNQQINFPNLIIDKEAGLGPFGAIFSALETKPDEAFFVIATDLPFVEEDIVKLLIVNRDKDKYATTLQAKNKDYPEPLATIWEPKTLTVLQKFYQKQIYKPIQVLKKIETKIVFVEDYIVKNINTDLEYQKVKKELNKKRES